MSWVRAEFIVVWLKEKPLEQEFFIDFFYFAMIFMTKTCLFQSPTVYW